MSPRIRSLGTFLVVIALLTVILAAAGCGNSSSVNVAGPSADRCGVTVTGGGTPLPAAGGAGSLTVATDRECAWSARAESSWISLSNTGGQGPGTLTYSVQPNAAGTQRRGSIAVGVQRVEIVQDAAPCRYEFTSSPVELGPEGGAADVGLSAPTGCSWTAEISDGWVTAEPSAGSGAATIRLRVGQNPGAARSAHVRIGGAALAVTQAAGSISPSPGPSPPPEAPRPPPPPPQPAPQCAYDIAPTRTATPASGGTFTVTITSPAGCAWAAASDVPWISIVGAAEGAGSGSVLVQVQANTGSGRTGVVRLAGRTLTVEQEAGRTAPPCSYSIKPTYYNSGRGPDDISITVTTDRQCPWSASSRASWATISEGQTGTGSGTVRVLVEANSGPARSTTLTIAGQPFALAQEGGCEVSLKPAHYNAGPGPDDIKVQVNMKGNCSWTASSPVSWATIVEGASGSGNGTVRIRVQPNQGPARSATLTIADSPFALAQESR